MALAQHIHVECTCTSTYILEMIAGAILTLLIKKISYIKKKITPNRFFQSCMRYFYAPLIHFPRNFDFTSK